MKLLEASRIHANKLDDYGYTPLHFAAQHNNIEIMELLLANGAHPDGLGNDRSKKHCGATPLHRAG